MGEEKLSKRMVEKLGGTDLTMPINDFAEIINEVTELEGRLVWESAEVNSLRGKLANQNTAALKYKAQFDESDKKLVQCEMDLDAAKKRIHALEGESKELREEVKSWKQASASNFAESRALRIKLEEIEADRFRKASKLQAELSKLKSSEQWAVTCEGMGEESAASLARALHEDGGIPYRAVPLAGKGAGGDGPWVVIAHHRDGLRHVVFSPDKLAIGAIESCHATRFDSHAEAVVAAEEYKRLHESHDAWPVLLADVKGGQR